MNIKEIGERTMALLEQLTAVWEASVRATHDFLSDAEIERIRGYVPQALSGVEHLIVAERTDGSPAAFMGVEGERLEMLFLAPDVRGAGLGRQMLAYGIKQFGVRELTVNEQNPQAVGFYRHMGFETYQRTEKDEQGGSYPLLYMRRK